MARLCGDSMPGRYFSSESRSNCLSSNSGFNSDQLLLCDYQQLSSSKPAQYSVQRFDLDDPSRTLVAAQILNEERPVVV